MKTARFSDVVAAGGRPDVHITWMDPGTDRTLQAAARQARVVTVHQHARGAKKDFAEVGVVPGKGAQFLIFPKTVRRFADRRIVGVRYDLIADAATVEASRVEKAPPPAARKKAIAPEPQPHAPPIPFEPPEDADPIKAEIRRALSELSSGQLAKVKRRLKALL